MICKHGLQSTECFTCSLGTTPKMPKPKPPLPAPPKLPKPKPKPMTPVKKPIPVPNLRFERVGPGVLMLRGNLEKPGAMQRLRELLNASQQDAPPG